MLKKNDKQAVKKQKMSKKMHRSFGNIIDAPWDSSTWLEMARSYRDIGSKRSAQGCYLIYLMRDRTGDAMSRKEAHDFIKS